MEVEFLVRNNVLPKYGFPVDTVELHQNANNASDKKLKRLEIIAEKQREGNYAEKINKRTGIYGFYQ